MNPFTLSWMLADWTVEVARDESVAAQLNEPSCAGSGDEWLSCDGSYATHRSAHMIRAVQLCLEQLTSKECIQEGLPKEIQSVDGTPSHVEDTHIRVDTTNRHGEHSVNIRVRESDKSDQVTHGKDAGEETSLDGTTNKLLQN
jgi:hypothetical protein